jgi:hypothetical protein
MPNIVDKTCKRCNRVLPIECFSPNKCAPGQSLAWCNECTSSQKRDYNKSRPEPPEDGTKICEKCHRDLHVSEFHKHKGCVDGLRPSCRECHASRQREISKARFNQLILVRKVCSVCFVEKEPYEFRRCGKSADGLGPTCRDCHSIPDPNAPPTKVCLDCKLELPSSRFSVNRSIVGGLHTRCRECDRVKRRSRKLADPEKYRQTTYENRLRRQYGLEISEFNRLFSEQGGRCAICGGTNDTLPNRPPLYVDHNHATGQVRSLLCNKCNAVLGMVDEDTNRLMKMVQYLDTWNTQVYGLEV